MDEIALSRPTFGEEEVEAVREALESGWVAGQGPRGRLLEERFADLCGTEHAIAVANCTAALHLALLARGVGTGDEVLVADYTYPATGHSVCYTSGTPVFVDVRPDLWTIDPDAAAAAVTERTVGIIAVDAFGQCADYDELQAIADRHGLFLIEDAACGVGSRYKDRAAGSLADIACFSLHARKGITSGEGGVVTTSDAAAAETVRKLSCFGVESALSRSTSTGLPVPVFEALGYNYKLSDIQAAVALVQLGRLDDLLARRRTIARHYEELLGDHERVQTPVHAPDREHSWQSYVVTLGPDVPRGDVAAKLRASGIGVNIGTFASHVQPVYGTTTNCPVSRDVFERHLAIPMHANLAETDVERVASELRAAVDAV